MTIPLFPIKLPSTDHSPFTNSPVNTGSIQRLSILSGQLTFMQWLANSSIIFIAFDSKQYPNVCKLVNINPFKLELLEEQNLYWLGQLIELQRLPKRCRIKNTPTLNYDLAIICSSKQQAKRHQSWLPIFKEGINSFKIALHTAKIKLSNQYRHEEALKSKIDKVTSQKAKALGPSIQMCQTSEYSQNTLLNDTFSFIF